MGKSSPSASPARGDQELVITRLFKAPRETVFDCFTDPDSISSWWGPDGFTTTTHSMDVRTGGHWSYTMHGPDGTDYENYNSYVDVVRPERLVYRHGSSPTPGPDDFMASLRLDETREGTHVTLTMRLASPETRAAMLKFGAVEGGHQTLARLAGHLSSTVDASGAARRLETPGAPAFEYSRIFNAPLWLVWQCHRDADHLGHWWGPKGCKLDVLSLDFRPGGLFHYAMRYSSGAGMHGRFIYRDIVAPTRLVYVTSFTNSEAGIVRAPFSADCPLELLNDITFSSHEHGKTKLALRVTPYGAAENEIAFFKGLMPSLELGYGGTLDQLEDYLPRIARA